MTHTHTRNTLTVASTVLFLGTAGRSSEAFVEICYARRSLSITLVLFNNHPKPFFSFACHHHEEMQGNVNICYLYILKESY